MGAEFEIGNRAHPAIEAGGMQPQILPPDWSLFSDILKKKDQGAEYHRFLVERLGAVRDITSYHLPQSMLTKDGDAGFTFGTSVIVNPSEESALVTGFLGQQGTSYPLRDAATILKKDEGGEPTALEFIIRSGEKEATTITLTNQINRKTQRRKVKPSEKPDEHHLESMPGEKEEAVEVTVHESTHLAVRIQRTRFNGEEDRRDVVNVAKTLPVSPIR